MLFTPWFEMMYETYSYQTIVKTNDSLSIAEDLKGSSMLSLEIMKVLWGVKRFAYWNLSVHYLRVGYLA